ncbi:MAG: two pore domain potassium channel family protein [Verrucomicrobiae bacterium]|nr:two pore domain potassium channel family protein [Verrucomicrobiae bacterium]MCB1085885.1 two pore domain potassium channel family protein [Verrucomicrobiae bacterium]
MRPAFRLQSLLLLVALLLVIASAFSEGPNFLGTLIYLGVFSVAGYLLGARRRWLTAYVSLALPALAFGIAAAAKGGDGLVIATDVLSMGVQALLIGLVFRFSLFDQGANRLDRVVAGICGYLILALFWGNLYSIQVTLYPESILDRGVSGLERAEGGLIYFSLITLSTVGFGDITPVSPGARLLTGLQAIAGTLYLAVLISTLVGSKSREGN